MATETLLALCTCPDEAIARSIAETLVKQRLAACVNILPAIRSVYRWQDSIENDPEVLLYIKTTRARWQALEQAIVGAHPYELPEIIGIPITAGLGEYLDWISEETRNA